MNSNLDVWAIQNNKDEISNALKCVKKDSLGNILYLNCVCRLKIGDTVVKNRKFDSCFYSEESDVIIFFAKGKITKEEIEQYLSDYNIHYTTISFLEDSKEFEDDVGEIELWFAREKYVLEEAIEDSLKKKIDMCLYYPGEKSLIYLGYKNSEDRFIPIDGRVCEGTIVFKDKLVLLVSQNDPKNISRKEAIGILENKGIVVIERGNMKGR